MPEPSATAAAIAPKRTPKPGQSFVARQPILTREERLFGYEILFRDGIEDYFASTNPEAASRSTLDTSIIMGLDVLTEGKVAFINCTREVLIKDYISLLPSNQTVVEVLESVPCDDLVIAAVRRSKEAGYLIALDDFVYDDPREPLTDLADIIKVDLRVTNMAQCALMVKKYGPWRCRMLAEKVETREEFSKAKECGFVYFQGYFFRRPETLVAHSIPANQMNYVRMLQAVAKDDLDVRELERVIKSEASLCYRLLRYLNSAAFGFSSEIQSIRHALSMLGEREVRRWIRLVATMGAGQGKSTELVRSALVRARFCELMSPKVNHGDSDMFLLGLLSLMDAILDLPMVNIVENVPLDQETKSVLLGGASRLRPIYRLMLAAEAGDFEGGKECARELGVQDSEVSECYWAALQWAREVSEG